MPNIYEGKISDGRIAGTGRFAIVQARFNETITGRLLDGCVATLIESGVDDSRIDVARVPGAFEIPLVAERFASAGWYDAVICLGCVIRGETTHDQHINRSVSLELIEISRIRRLPVIYGVLTCNTLEQAIARSGGRVGEEGATTSKDIEDVRLGNKGIDAARAALEMVVLLHDLPC